MKSWFQAQLKKKARIYILPTKMGGYLNGLIFLMFLLSIGYSNNLLLIFTLVLFGFNLIWVIQTHFHLNALRLQGVEVSSGHAKEPLSVTVHWKSAPMGKLNWELSLHGNVDTVIHAFGHEVERSLGEIRLLDRGFYRWEHFKVKTRMPFGLYVAWTYLPINSTAYSYPERLKDTFSALLSSSQKEGDHAGYKKGPHDIWNLGPYRGDDSHRISWKHYAHSGELVVKEGEEQIQREVFFQLQYEKESKEYALSKLATQMVQCSKDAIPFSLEIHGRRIPVDNTERHLHKCLRELSLC